MTEHWYELWRQDYNTFGDGDWYLEVKLKDRAVAQLIIDTAGWGTRYEIRGLPPEETQPEWAGLSFEEFDANYVVEYGTVYTRNSETGRSIVRDRIRAQRRTEQIELNRLKKIDRRGRVLP